jgi:predicted amidohydrolase
MRVATVQLTSTENKDAIREGADSLTRRAASAGPELVVRRPEVYA